MSRLGVIRNPSNISNMRPRGSVARVVNPASHNERAVRARLSGQVTPRPGGIWHSIRRHPSSHLHPGGLRVDVQPELRAPAAGHADSPGEVGAGVQGAED